MRKAGAAAGTGLAGYVGASWFLAFFGGPIAAYALLRATASAVMAFAAVALVVDVAIFGFWTYAFFTALEGAR